MKSFQELNLSEEILRAISDLGFENPTPIQEKSIEHFENSESDLIALAQTGTGKTAAFGLPILNRIDIDNRNTQALVLCPTRELCLQICNDIKSFATYVKGFKTTAVYGGANISDQIKDLNRGVHIVVGTPGRTLDLINRKKLNVGSIQYMVLDEADEMLSMGFKDDLDAILAATPDEKQTLCYSATMPRDMVEIAEKYMHKPVQVSVGKKNTGTVNVDHEYYMVHSKDRYIALKRIVDVYPNVYAIIFCRTRSETKEVASKLSNEGYNVDALHGDLSQAQRDYVMEKFRSKQLQLLVATDVAARGLDVNDLSHVINYNLPDELEAYIHRSGRTGRANKKGVSLSIIHTREVSKIKQIEKKINRNIEHKQVPSGQDICEKQLFNLIDKVEKIEVDKEQIEPFLPTVIKKLEWLSREDLIAHFVSAEFNRFLNYYKDAQDINAKGRSSRDDERDFRGSKHKAERRDRGSKRVNGSYARFFINVGAKDSLNPKKLIQIINQSLPNKRFGIGQIDILDAFSFFEVEKNVEQDIAHAMSKQRYNNTKINVELSKPKKGKRR